MKLHLDVRVLKGIALALAVVLVVLVGLLCLKRWDESRGQLAERDTAGESPTASEDSREVIYVNGQAYALRDLETILLLGVDKFEGETPEGYLNNQQADFLLLLVLDEAGETCTPIQLNRDTMTQIQILGVNGEPAGTMTGQLALAHTYGGGEEDSCENTVLAVENLLYGVEIDHYVSMTMDGGGPPQRPGGRCDPRGAGRLLHHRRHPGAGGNCDIERPAGPDLPRRNGGQYQPPPHGAPAAVPLRPAGAAFQQGPVG